MAWAGLLWVFPPKGMSTEAAPMVLSKRSVRPRRLAHFRLPAISFRSENSAVPSLLRSFFST